MCHQFLFNIIIYHKGLTKSLKVLVLYCNVYDSIISFQIVD